MFSNSWLSPVAHIKNKCLLNYGMQIFLHVFCFSLLEVPGHFGKTLIIEPHRWNIFTVVGSIWSGGGGKRQAKSSKVPLLYFEL